jgi:hypothetical protein
LNGPKNDGLKSGDIHFLLLFQHWDEGVTGQKQSISSKEIFPFMFKPP